jgi:hypothetical protein
MDISSSFVIADSMNEWSFSLLIALLSVLLFSPFENSYSEGGLQVIVQSDQPSNDGLYIEGQPIHTTVVIKNLLNQDERVLISGDLQRVFPGSPHIFADFSSLQRDIPAGQNTTIPINLVYQAGTYRIYAVASINNTGYGDSKEVYFTVYTQQDLFAKQQASSSFWSMVIAVIAVGTGSAFSFFTIREGRRQRAETVSEMQEQRRISENALKISQEQTRLEQRPWIGRVDIVHSGAILNTGQEVPHDKIRVQRWGGHLKAHRFKFWMKNYGKLPALNCGTAYGILTPNNSQIPAEDPGPEWFEKLEFHQFIAVMPGETFPMNIDIPIEKGPCCFIVGRVKYEYSGGSGFYDFIVEYDGSNWVPKFNKLG